MALTYLITQSHHFTSLCTGHCASRLDNKINKLKIQRRGQGMLYDDH